MSAVDDRPDWMKTAGVGIDADMTPDPMPGSGSSIRFWMPKGTERRIVFLTEGNAAPSLFEHRVRLGGSWHNWFTCLSHLGMPCDLCDYADSHKGQMRRSKVMYFTVIDTHEFVDSTGKSRKNLKKLFAAYKDTTELLKRQYLKRLQEEQGLRGAIYDVFRTNSEKSASVGEQFDFVKMADLAALEDSDELKYMELLKPNPTLVKRAAERLIREGSSSGPDLGGKSESRKATEEGTDATVPF